MSHFEHTSEEFPALGGQKSKEQIAEMRREQQEAEERKIEFLAEQKRKRESVDSTERRARQRRSEEILKAEVVEILLRECPFLEEVDAKILYNNEIRNLIAVERFRAAYFGQPASAKALALLGVTKM